MPGNIRSKSVTLPFPRKGTDQGSPLTFQPEGTTPNCLNVRAVDARNRTGGGKRGGIVKAITSQAGVGLTSQRIVGLSMLADARSAPGALTASTALLTTVDFTGIAASTPVDTAGVTNGVDLVGFRHSQIATPIAVNIYTEHNGSGGFLGLNAISIGATGVLPAQGLSPLYLTENDCTAYTRSTNVLSFATNFGWGGAGEAWGCGPFIRGDAALTTMIMARLRPTAAGTFKLEIVEIGTSASTTTQTTLASSANQAFTALGGSSDAIIRLYETATGVTAICNWADQAVVNLTVSATTTTNQGNSRCGVCLGTDTGSGSGAGAGTVANFRIISKVIYTKRVPESSVVYATADVSVATTTTNNYVPFNFRSQGWTAGGATVTTNDASSAELGLGAGPAATPSVDDGSNYIEFLQSAGSTTYGFLGQITVPSDYRGVDWQPIVGGSGGGSSTQRGGAAFRVSDDGKSYVACRVAINSATATTVGEAFINLQTTNVSSLVVDNLTVATTTVGGASVRQFSIRESTRVKFTDDGTTIRLYANGILFFSYVPASVPAGIASNRRCGAYMEQNSTGIGTLTPSRFGTIRIVSGESIVQDFTEAKPLILVQNKGRSSIADIVANTLNPCVGFPSLSGEMPQIASLFRKFYLVDGTSSGGIVVDPITYTVTDWTASVGTAPWDGGTPDYMRLICTYRGRLVLARGSVNPTMWYMTRVGAPTDFDYGATPTSTAAYAGSTGSAGQPGDTITALVPYNDDYLIIGGSHSISMMEGDPGYEGSVQVVTTKTGILGPRAWCVDHKGNLFFMGMGGLYMMPRGSKDFTNISGRRLINFLDRINLTTTLVHMAFDAFRRYVHVWFTATNNVDNNNHCVYDPETDSFWIDQHPIRFGPWAACDSTGGSYVDMGWLIGGDDGYLRRPYDLSFDDDTDAIDSWIDIGPFQMDQGDITSVITEIQADIGSGSGDLTWYWFTGDSPELVAAQDFGDEVASGTFVANRNTPVRLRKRGGAHKIRLRNNTATDNWSLEQVRGWYMPGGRRR